MKPKLTVVGACGRMGRLILSLAAEAGRFEVVGAVEQEGHPDLGTDLSRLIGAKETAVKLECRFPDACDVVIDFSGTEAAASVVDFCADKKIPLVMGTTGLSEAQRKKVENAAGVIPLIYGTNMSVGMNVLFSLVGKAASMLGDDYDIEIVEQHHRFKKDAPSGSALTLAENVCKATGRNYPGCLNFGRHGKDALRKKDTIGIHAVRAGDIAGKHEVFFSTLGETVCLAHNAHTREGFARGALRAAEWLIGKSPGLYTMADVLGLS
ncbi:MAG: 4-hydroxy-tetrahydrodipicolinate reductase [Phycisphaerales bacterium]